MPDPPPGRTLISFPDKRLISASLCLVLVPWLSFSLPIFILFLFILLPLIITMFRPFHHVMSLFSLVNLTGLLFACLERKGLHTCIQLRAKGWLENGNKIPPDQNTLGAGPNQSPKFHCISSHSQGAVGGQCFSSRIFCVVKLAPYLDSSDGLLVFSKHLLVI